ncbi:MAG: DNA-binding transcriptional regulator, LysR family [Bradyrhizobium sp.]|nr:DNA-binding transcriptional regulator, LysR family [Bradyrhizobium sp.]
MPATAAVSDLPPVTTIKRSYDALVPCNARTSEHLSRFERVCLTRRWLFSNRERDICVGEGGPPRRTFALWPCAHWAFALKSAMSDRLTALKLFTRAARVGNFSVAGRELGISQPSASRMIAALESDVGAALFNRTTRAVMLTEAGALYLARVEVILAALLDADHEARGTGELRGVLRIGTSSSFALREIIPRLAPFTVDHPSLKIELWANDHGHDLVTDSIDVAIRRGPLADSSASARKLFEVPRILVAAPVYLTLRGIPQTPEQLIEHAIIAGPEPYLPPLLYQKDGKAVAVKTESHLTVTLLEGVIASALAGLGMVATSSRSVQRELESGALVRVLSGWDFGRIEIHAVFVNGRAIKPAARAFADFLAGELRD